LYHCKIIFYILAYKAKDINHRTIKGDILLEEAKNTLKNLKFRTEII
jgi:hypothetical protein